LGTALAFFIGQIPLAAGALWFSLASLRDARVLWRVPEGKALVGSIICLGVTEVIVWLKLNRPSDFYLLDSLESTSLAMATTFAFLFSKWANLRRQTLDLGVFATSAFALAVLWRAGGDVEFSVDQQPLEVARPLEVGLVFDGYLSALGVLAFAFLFLGSVKLRRRNPREALRLAMVYGGIAMGSLVAGLASHGVLVAGVPQVGALASASRLVGATMLLILLSPRRGVPLSQLIMAIHLGAEEVKAAYLVGNSGRLLASATKEGAVPLTAEILVGTLDLISDYMATTFAAGVGEAVSAVHQGELGLVMEQGRFTRLILQITGEETVSLRLRMRHALATFEGRYWDILAKDRVGDLMAAGPLVRSFVQGTPGWAPS
jgi:hypothetical protein